MCFVVVVLARRSGLAEWIVHGVHGALTASERSFDMGAKGILHIVMARGVAVMTIPTLKRGAQIGEPS